VGAGSGESNREERRELWSGGSSGAEERWEQRSGGCGVAVRGGGRGVATIEGGEEGMETGRGDGAE